MLFYNWPKIKKHSNGKVQMIRVILESMLEDGRPHFARGRYDKIDFSGESYLLRPDKLLTAFQFYNQVDAANYLMLASYRNYAEYKLTGDCSLPINFVTIPTDKLKQNSLLDVTSTNIHFLLEK